ncbi:MAG TPA: acetylornithine/succinylornithine family transaminase [Tepidisphaeraceae bacterium]|nr:acetylornithine/succinylornithine family transaminase [Tepidisphaeraceae bacterium]
MSHTQEVLDRAKNVLIRNYARQPIVMARGEGSYVWNTNGKRYLDLFAGFGGGILGHCHPAQVQAATDQAKKLWHVGNTFHTEPQVEFAERLNKHAFKGQAFFCHSGLEANEAATKLARLRGSHSTKKKWKTISFTKSFHGRSLAMIAATGNPKVREGFEPPVPGFSQVELGDLEGLTGAVDDEVSAIIVEPIQGEGGIHPVPPDFALELRRLCDARGITLIYDEVWTGGGRTGKWFGHQHLTDPSGKVIEPDIMTLGKAVGGGLPVGVMYAKPELAALLTPGKHGCTLGGNPICMAVARTIFDVIEQEKLLENAVTLGEIAVARLRNEPKISNKIADIRGKGLMLGIELREPPEKIVEKGLDRGIIINLTAQKVIRLAPPININKELWHQGLDILIQTIAA